MARTTSSRAAAPAAHAMTRQAHGQLARALAELAGMDPQARLYAWDLARLAGVSPKTITRYNTGETAKRRAAGQARPQDLPAPAGHERVTAELAGRFGLHTGGPPIPYWHPPQATVWLPERQSSGNPRGGKPLPRKIRRKRPGPRRGATGGS